MDEPVVLMAVGDLLLGGVEAEVYFDKARDVVKSADVAVAMVEYPHTDRGDICAVDMPAPAGKPGHLAALKNGGFDVATVGGNHIFDQGTAGVVDTLDTLHSLGIETVGAGINLDEARKPLIVERKGVRIGFLSYNCVGPRESWATPVKAGAAYIYVMTHYELEYASPGSRPAEFSFPHPDHQEWMERDIAELRKQADVVVVSLHKGMLRVPARIASYERQLSKAAIDAGADVVIGHHAHILKGVEVYKGKPIFHGINHFVVVYAKAEEAKNMAGRDSRMYDRDFFKKAHREPAPNDRDPNGGNFRFAAESRNTIIATCTFDKQGILTAGFIPCWINDQEQPEPFGQDERGTSVVEYMEKITRAIGSPVEFKWDKDRVVFLDKTKSISA